MESILNELTTDYVGIGDGVHARKVKESPYIPTTRKGMIDRVYSFTGRYLTAITLTLDPEVKDSKKIKEAMGNFQQRLNCLYIGVLEYGESAREKNPISPHYHYLVDRKISSALQDSWKAECGVGEWSAIKGLWFDAIRSQSAMMDYTTKFDKGNRDVKDYSTPPVGYEGVDLQQIVSSKYFHRHCNRKVSLTVDNEVLDFFCVRKYDYIKLPQLRSVEPTTHITFDGIDWDTYSNVEVLWLAQQYLVRCINKGAITDTNWDYLSGVFGVSGDDLDLVNTDIIYILNKLKSNLVSVTPYFRDHQNYKDVYEAGRATLNEFGHIPPLYTNDMVFKFDEWRNMTNYYYKGR